MLFGIRWGSLRTKIVAWSFVPTMIILVIVAVVIFYAYQDVTEDLVVERNGDLTRLAADKFRAELHAFADLLEAEARAPDMSGSEPEAQRDALRGASNRLAVFDAGVLVLDTFGTVVAAEPERPGILEQNWSDRAFYRQVLRAQIEGSSDAVFSDVVDDGPDGSEVVVVAVPIAGTRGEFLGTVAGMFRVGATTVSAFYGGIVGLRIEGTASAYLMDGQGRVIYHSDAEHVGDDFSTQPLAQAVMAGDAGAVRTRDLAGREIVASFAPVPDTPWSLVVEESWTAVTSGSRAYQQFLLLLLVLGVTVPILVVAVGVRRITRPIVELIGAAREVAKGNFGQTITAQTGDEVEELAEQFSLMSAQLQEWYASLEQQCAARTKELATLNAIAATVSQSRELSDVLNEALDMTLEVMDIEAGGIYLLDEEAGVLNVAVQRGFRPDFVDAIDGLKVGEGFSGRVAASGEPLVINDVSADSRLTRQEVKAEGLRSVAITPLSSKGKVLGTLFTSTHGYREFTEQDVQLLTSIGHQIGVAIENVRLLEAEQRRADQFRVISEVGQRVTSILALDELLCQIVRLIQQAFEYDIVEIALVEEDELVFRARAERQPGEPFETFRLKVDEGSITGWVAATGEPALVPDVDQERRYVQVTDSASRSELAVPIKAKDNVIGVLNIQSKQLDAFDDSDLAVIQSLADQAAIAIESARLFEAEQRRAEQFRVIGKVGHHITSILDVDVLLEEIVRTLKDTYGHYLVTIGLIEGEELVFRAGAKANWPEPQFRPAPVKVGKHGITGWVAATGEPLLANDVSQEPRYVFWPDAPETRSELAVPMKTKSGVIGVLNVESDELQAFDESDLEVLQSLAHQAAVAIENARHYRQAQQLAVVEERQRLARELHDSVTQALFAATLYAEAAARLLASGEVDQATQHLRELKDTAQEALREMRLLIFELRPSVLEDEGLVGALRVRLEAVEERAGLQTELEVQGEGRLPPHVEAGLYRIAQEALNNALKHSQAGAITVCLRQDVQTVKLEVTDDGVGFDPSTAVEFGGLGLDGMEERAAELGGRLEIESSPGAGACVRVEVNL